MHDKTRFTFTPEKCVIVCSKSFSIDLIVSKWLSEWLFNNFFDKWWELHRGALFMFLWQLILVYWFKVGHVDLWADKKLRFLLFWSKLTQIVNFIQIITAVNLIEHKRQFEFFIGKRLIISFYIWRYILLAAINIKCEVLFYWGALGCWEIAHNLFYGSLLDHDCLNTVIATFCDF